MAIDWEVVEQLMELDMDDPEFTFTKQVFHDFFEQLDEKIPALTQFVIAKDYENAAKLGHYLKGSSAAIGAVALSQISEDIQHCQEKKDDPQAYLMRLLHELQTAYPPVKRQLLQRVGE